MEAWHPWAAGALVAGAVALRYWLRDLARRWRNAARRRRADEGEREAERLLRRRGYRVLERQVGGALTYRLDGAEVPAGLDPAVFSVVARDDGSMQLKAGRRPLYTFAGDDASPLGSLPLSQTFGSVGMELHPTLGVIYACGVTGDPSSLYRVDPDNGDVSMVATTDLNANCSNLAAPFGPGECIPQ